MVCRRYPKWCHPCFSVLCLLPIAHGWPITCYKAMLHAIELLFFVIHNPFSSPLEFLSIHGCTTDIVSYPVISLWSQWSHSSVNVRGFLSSFCLLPMLHAYKSLEIDTWLYCLERASLSFFHHTVPSVLPNCTLGFHSASEFKPQFK